MKKISILLFVASLFLSFAAFSDTTSVRSKNYEEAATKKSFIKFDMKSTKLGFITTSFDGVVKNFTLNYTRTENMLTELELSLAVKDLDTDNGSRNEKMHEHCLTASKFPTIKINIKSPINQSLKSQKNSGTIIIRGKKKILPIEISTQIKDGFIAISGFARGSIKALEIPDPSIAVASVKDNIDINFNFLIPKK